MSDEPTIRYCLEHNTSDMLGVDSCVYRTGVVLCEIVTLRRRAIQWGDGPFFYMEDEAGGVDAYIWTEEP